MVSVITGVGATEGYACSHKYSDWCWLCFCSLLDNIHNGKKALTTGSALAGGFYCVGGVIGAGISVLSDEDV